ncbi:aminodeoxychorismate lyase [Leifsonia sp. NPDC058292]|uniref:aminodeoxychorismate lyase n=1 Tax=Leifsonia sp. NPDC058292 TaxID=3346428 RepID=UPI0036D879B2
MTRATLLTLTAPTTASAGSAHSAGFASVDADAPQVNLMDLGLTRGDGVFETISVVDGHPQALEPHLERLAHSAELLDIAEPDLTLWRDAVLAGIAENRPLNPGTRELFAKLILTRGVEGSGSPSGWVYVAPAEDFAAAREGIRVVTLDRGYAHDVAETSPWLLAGAKTLSYATNRAALREASRRGADDVIFISSDGFVLEGPTSNVIVLGGDTVRTPQTDQGILAGTTQASVFEFFAQRGLSTSYERITADELVAADAIWLVSSVRQAAPVTQLDGEPLGVDAGLTAALNEFLLSRTS